LIGATEIAHATIAAVAIDDASKCSHGRCSSNYANPNWPAYMSRTPGAKPNSFAHFCVQVGDIGKMHIPS